MLHTFKVVLNKSHGVVIFASAHGLDPRAEAGDGENDDIADLLGRLHTCKVLPGDVTLGGAHIEVVGIVEECENGVGPDGRTRELDDALGILAECTSIFAL